MAFISRALVACFVSIAFTGCASRVDNEPGFVQRQWSAQMQELGIFPTFPPREQMYVGDVYLFPLTFRNVDFSEDLRTQQLSYSRLVGTLPIGGGTSDSIVAAFQTSRPDFPASGTSFQQQAAASGNPADANPRPQPATSDVNIFANPNAGNRLGMAGFPGFLTVTYDQFDFGAFAPLQQISIALGISQANTDTVTVSIPFAESYGVPMSYLWPFAVRDDGRLNPEMFGSEMARRINQQLDESQSCVQATSEPRAGQAAVLPLPLLGTFAATPFALQNLDQRPMLSALFAVLSEVFYARSIDVSTRATSAFAADLQAALAAPTQYTIIPTSSAPDTGTSQEIQVQSGESAVVTESSIILTRARETAASLDRTQPGITTNVVSVTGAGVTLRQTFDRPVAIGWRGFIVEVDLRSLCVRNVPVESLGPYDVTPIGTGSFSPVPPVGPATAGQSEPSQAPTGCSDLTQALGPPGFASQAGRGESSIQGVGALPPLYGELSDEEQQGCVCMNETTRNAHWQCPSLPPEGDPIDAIGTFNRLLDR